MYADGLAGELRMEYLERQNRFEENKKELHQVFLLRRLFFGSWKCDDGHRVRNMGRKIGQGKSRHLMAVQSRSAQHCSAVYRDDKTGNDRNGRRQKKTQKDINKKQISWATVSLAEMSRYFFLPFVSKLASDLL